MNNFYLLCDELHKLKSFLDLLYVHTDNLNKNVLFKEEHS